MARNGLKWPFKGHLRPVQNHVDHHIFQLITACLLYGHNEPRISTDTDVSDELTAQ